MKEIEEKDFDIVPRLIEASSFIFLIKKIQVYDIIPKKDFRKTEKITSLVKGISSFEDAVIFLQNYIKHYNAPKYIIEKNSMGKYRYRKKLRYSRVDFYCKDFNVYYDPPPPGQIFSSLEEIKKHLFGIENENKWETIEEIYE